MNQQAAFAHRYPRPVTAYPAKVLLVDDDADSRAVVACALRRDGHWVVEFRDGPSLFDRLGPVSRGGLRGGRADLVVTDIRMPGMTGLEVLSDLRSAGWSVPVILISAFADARTESDANQLGAAALFRKPFDLDDLRTAVLHLTRWH